MLNLMNNNSMKVKEMDYIWYFALFLLAINFLAMQNLLLIFVLSIGFSILLIRDLKFKITIDLSILVLFSLTYFLIFSYHEGVSSGSFYILLLAPVSVFILGYFIMGENEKFLKFTIFAITIGFFMRGFLNMLLYISNYGFNSLYRSVPDIWTGSDFTATLTGTYFTLVVSSSIFIFIYWSKKKYAMSIAIFLTVLFSIFSSVILGNRTLIILMFLVFVSSTVLYFILNNHKLKNAYKLIGSMTFFALVFLIFYNINLFDLRDIYENSNFRTRMETASIAEDPRMDIYLSIANQLFQYPFGGHVISLNYAHNLWLDVLLVTGLIPFFLLIIFTLTVISNIIKIILNPKVNVEIKILIFSVFSGLMLNFMVEPILEGVPFLFILFCLLSGMLKKYSDLMK